MLDVNTTSIYSTHFLRGVELIQRGREKFKVCSENWPHPTGDRFGVPGDPYYAEIWVDGMDWQPSYWLIEEKKFESPIVYPFIIFESNEDRDRFNNYDFKQLINGCLWYRRDFFWIKNNDLGIYTDYTWPYLIVLDKNTFRNKDLIKVCFKHASQPNVEFWMNHKFIPLQYLEREYDEEDCDNWL